MMKRILLILAAGAMAMFGSAPASAVSLLDGQTHYYTVQFRSDNKAVVYAKLVFQNGDSAKERDSFSFSLPSGVKVESLTVQQILTKAGTSSCKRYETYDAYYKRTGVSTSSIKPSAESLQCLEPASGYNEDFDYTSNSNGYSYYYDYYYPEYRRTENYEYTDVSPAIANDTYTLKLPHAIKPHKQGAVLVSFISESYASGLMGRFNYDFRTFKATELIDRANVAINFDEELYSREATQKRTTESAPGALTQGVAADTSYRSKSLDSIIGTVGGGGTYTRTQTKMLPGDVMRVSGVYATKPLLLYLKEIVLLLLVVATVAAASWVLYRRYRRKHPHAAKKQAAAQSATPAKAMLVDDAQQTVSIPRLFIVSAVSTGATLVALAVLAVLVAIANNSYSAFSPFVLSVYSVVVVGTTALIGPFVYSLRYGIRAAFTWLLINIGVVTLLCFLALGVVALLTSGNSYPYPIERY